MKNIRALSISTIWTVILITFMTILTELSKASKSVIASVGGHHWIGKGIIALVFFVLLYYFLNKPSQKEDVSKLVKQVIFFSVLGSLVIFLFYVYEFFA